MSQVDRSPLSALVALRAWLGRGVFGVDVSSSSSARHSARRDLRKLWVICGVALVLRAAFVLAVSAGPSWDGVIYERAAEQLAHGQGYTQRILNPEAPSKPTAFFPPGYAAVLSVLHRLAGGRALDPWLQVLCTALLVPAAWCFGRRLAGPRAGNVAAWWVALWPGGIVLSASWFTEPLFAVLLCLSIVPLLYVPERARTRAIIVSGITLGLAAYVRPTSLVVSPLVGAVSGWMSSAPSFRARALRGGACAVLALGCSLLPLAPWVARNQAALGAPVLVSTNGGLNLLLGTLGEGGYGSLDPRYDCPSGMREVDVDRCRSERALSRIRQDPVSWMARGVLKVVHTLGHDSAPAQMLSGGLRRGERSERVVLVTLALCRTVWLSFLALALVGLWIAWRGTYRRSFACWLLCAPPLGLLLLHFVYIGGDRYHAPLVPMLAAFAGLAWAELDRLASRDALKR